jgi:hypothetical protein
LDWETIKRQAVDLVQALNMDTDSSEEETFPINAEDVLQTRAFDVKAAAYLLDDLYYKIDRRKRLTRRKASKINFIE